MNRRQRKELNFIIEEAKRGLNICTKIIERELELSSRLNPAVPVNPKPHKVYEYILKQNIDKYAEKDLAWFEAGECSALSPRKLDLYRECYDKSYLTLDEIHKAAVSLWPEKYSFMPEPAIKNEVPNNALS